MGRKIIAFLLMGCIGLSLIACGSKGALDKDTKDLTKNRNKDVIHCFADTVISDKDFEETKATAELTDFSLRLLEENVTALEQENENILISPISIITALGMTSYGAKGDTLTQMEEMFGLSRGHLNHYNTQYLCNVAEELKVANSIWLSNDGRIEVNDAFLQFNEEFYGADIYTTSFNHATVKSINNWVNDKTDGTIKDILDRIPEDAVMYLINALVFEAEWEEKYEETQIRRKQKFTTSDGKTQKVDMMCSYEKAYLQDENATGFIKYYKDRNYAFAALLPNEDVDIKSYVQSLSGEDVQKLLANPIQTDVDVQIPQFSYEYDVEMSDILKELGMTAAFDGGAADFTNMATSTSGNIFINRVLHKTFIEVTPVGTKAGAATVVEMNLMSAPYFEELKQVYLNRPFIYMIIDCESNMPVFIGAVNSVK